MTISDVWYVVDSVYEDTKTQRLDCVVLDCVAENTLGWQCGYRACCMDLLNRLVDGES